MLFFIQWWPPYIRILKNTKRNLNLIQKEATDVYKINAATPVNTKAVNRSTKTCTFQPLYPPKNALNSHVHVGTVCLVTLRHWDSCVCKVRVRVILHYPATVALELYSYHRFNRKQVMWQSDKRDEEEGELTHSQDSRVPDGATVSWQDCQHTSHRGLCVSVCVHVCIYMHVWVFVSEKIHVSFPVCACMSSACEITVCM